MIHQDGIRFNDSSLDVVGSETAALVEPKAGGPSVGGLVLGGVVFDLRIHPRSNILHRVQATRTRGRAFLLRIARR